MEPTFTSAASVTLTPAVQAQIDAAIAACLLPTALLLMKESEQSPQKLLSPGCGTGRSPKALH